ncbi:hydroxymethylglutaryl-CoA lyase [Candidatus Berkiella cookevillensis]|uniref:Hydroxymethylglutaryl-CoA lyase n=3 Tax=Candidatus Berkiella cookevillensis TaxID=437022 RepID=A0AAE3HQ27_9GAMM|nr:hydroxymethylglutaryl-CoA lyase [Candidatus Berkiella cookevillensis]
MNNRMIKIVEVGPRDGLQNEKSILSTELKLNLIHKLMDAGLKTIEVTSFVSPKWVPQMADHTELVMQLSKVAGVRTIALVPNEKGLSNATAVGADSIAVFAAASESFSQKNINCSIAQSLDNFKQVIAQAKMQKQWIRGYISCVLGCPYEGHIAPTQVLNVANALYNAGCDEISIGDTIGVGTAKQAQSLIRDLKSSIPIEKLAVHFHDTYGQALANIYACMEEGIRIIDSSVSGLGGCPYAKGASGNVATEEVVYMLHGMGLKTGINLEKLINAGQYICDALNIKNRSKVANALLSKK